MKDSRFPKEDKEYFRFLEFMLDCSDGNETQTKILFDKLSPEDKSKLFERIPDFDNPSIGYERKFIRDLGRTTLAPGVLISMIITHRPNLDYITNYFDALKHCFGSDYFEDSSNIELQTV